MVVNGTTTPAPIAIAPGVAQRFRFAVISSNERLDVSLMKRDSVSQWRVVARDGAELPASQLRTTRARLQLSAGMTTDAEFTLPAGSAGPDGSTEFALRIHMRVYEAFDLPGSTITIPIVVRR